MPPITPWQWFKSLLYVLQVYAMMAIMAVYFVPLAVFSRDWAYRGVRTWCRYARWSAEKMVGLRTEVRGEVPTDEVLIASKHQSFLDIIILVSVLPRPKFIMKKELIWAPILGWFALRMGCVPVERGKRAQAIQQMMEGVKAGRQDPGQLVIYPQGTRVPPGEYRPYKIGTALLYEQLGQPCVPAATNVGLFWPKSGIWRRPGTAVLEFLPRISPGKPREAFLGELETVIETRSNELMREAGYDGPLPAPRQGNAQPTGRRGRKRG